ncbi:MAG: DUF5996 family protein [Chloroflexota bacterium]
MQIPDWNATKNTLHIAAQIMSAVRKAAGERQPNHLHHSLYPTPHGLRTGDIPGAGEVTLNYNAGTIAGAGFEITIAGKSSQAVFDELQTAVEPHNITLKAPDELSDDVMTFDADHAAAFTDLHREIFGALARTKAYLMGAQTPLVVWSHGFDMSTIWFSEGMDEDSDPHINMGFSPGTPDTPEPYLYFYTWPFRQQVVDSLPDIVTWNEAWGNPGGTVVYSKLAATPDVEATIVEILLHIYAVGSDALKS